MKKYFADYKKITNFAAQKSASGYLCRATNTIKA